MWIRRDFFFSDEVDCLQIKSKVRAQVYYSVGIWYDCLMWKPNLLRDSFSKQELRVWKLLV